MSERKRKLKIENGNNLSQKNCKLYPKFLGFIIYHNEILFTTAQKMKFFIKYFFIWRNSQVTTNLVKFTEEIHNEKFCFYCSVICILLKSFISIYREKLKLTKGQIFIKFLVGKTFSKNSTKIFQPFSFSLQSLHCRFCSLGEHIKIYAFLHFHQ